MQADTALPSRSVIRGSKQPRRGRFRSCPEHRDVSFSPVSSRKRVDISIDQSGIVIFQLWETTLKQCG